MNARDFALYLIVTAGVILACFVLFTFGHMIGAF